ncbi:MAG TPA: hypothetical protein VKF81_08875, partial [Blastocatellia bacterium]|nr:hypothetical protein [Blastocatellia bacterium]
TYFSIPYTDLPLKDRDPQHLVMLQQGITEHKERFSIGGRRPENKTALLDGIDDRDPVTGQFVASLSRINFGIQHRLHERRHDGEFELRPKQRAVDLGQ